MAKVKNVENAIQGTALAVAWVEPKDAIRQRLRRNMPGALGGAVGGAVGGMLTSALRDASEDTFSKNTGLAATAEGLWLFPLKAGFANLTAQPGGALIPRDQLASMEFGSGMANVPLTISTRDGDSIEFTVHKAYRKSVTAVKEALGL